MNVSKDPIPHNPTIWNAWKRGVIFNMEYHGVVCKWRIFGLDFGYDIAELLCLSDVHDGDKQAISTMKLLELLNGEGLSQVTFRYVNRWIDTDGSPHHHGVLSKYATLREAQSLIKFNMLDIETAIVYGPCTEKEMYEFMGDFIDDSNDSGDVGTMGWISQ